MILVYTNILIIPKSFEDEGHQVNFKATGMKNTC